MKLLESILQDVSYALRAMRRTPMMTAAAILSLGLGIGANTAIFSLIDTIMLRYLPVRSPQELVQFAWRTKVRPRKFLESTTGRGVEFDDGKNASLPFSLATYDFIRDHATTLAGVAGRARQYDPVTVIANGRPEAAQAEQVSGNFFDVLGVLPAAGRLFADIDDREGANPSAVLSHAYWLHRFGGDSSIAGQSISVNGTSFTVLGVVSAGFEGVEVGSGVDIYVPLHMQPLLAVNNPFNKPKLHTPAIWWIEITARRRPGVTDAQVRSEGETLFRQSLIPRDSAPPKPEDYPSLVVGQAGRGQSNLRWQFSKPLIVLMTIVGFVLLIGCANVANLLMARAVARRKEMAMRHALGATSSRLFRQMIAESIVLALAGGATGFAIAHWGTLALIRVFSPETSPLVLDVENNTMVLAFLIGVSLLVGLLFGLAPAIQSARIDLNTMLKGSLVDSARRFSMGRILVTIQVAVSLALLIGAGLYIRTLWNLRHVPLGFNTDNVLVFRLTPRSAGYKTETMSKLIDRIMPKLDSIAGVRGASYAQLPLLMNWQTSGPVHALGQPPDDNTTPQILDIGPSYLETMQIALLSGRSIGDRDVDGAPRVVVVNETFAKKYFPEASPIGRQITYWIDNHKTPMEIVGLIRDAHYTDVEREVRPVAYLPYLQHLNETTELSFVVRTNIDPRGIANSVREAVRDVDPNLPVIDMTTESAQLDASIRDQRLMADLAGGFGALALVLAAIGMYGVIAYSVSRRTAEIGIRMALGAGRNRVLGQVLRESLLPVAIGMIAGLGIAWGATKFIASQLYGLEPRDPSTMVAAAGLIVAVAIVATLLPARRAAQVDPMMALRHE